MTQRITVQTDMHSNFPEDAEIFRKFGGALTIKTMCAKALVEQGCNPDSIVLEEPYFEDGWKIRGIGEKE